MAYKLKKRKGRSNWYMIIDGIPVTTETDNKGLAVEVAKKREREDLGIRDEITVEAYYDRWITQKERDERDGIIRKSLLRNYRQEFTRYILPEIGSKLPSDIDLQALKDLRAKLRESLSIKTVRNIVDGSLRAMWRDGIVDGFINKAHNPFPLLQWPPLNRPQPDPFNPEERDAIVNWWRENDEFYYPFVLTQFWTGMRPSETTGLYVSDLHGNRLTISRSYNLGKIGAPKTNNSSRTIELYDFVVDALTEAIRIRNTQNPFLFQNRAGDPLDCATWRMSYWSRRLTALDIRPRKFYATRHTFISVGLSAGMNPKFLAEHCGTSLAMIQQSYGKYIGSYANELSKMARTISAPVAEKPVANRDVGTGRYPVEELAFCKPDACLPDLTDTAGIVGMLSRL